MTFEVNWGEISTNYWLFELLMDNWAVCDIISPTLFAKYKEEELAENQGLAKELVAVKETLSKTEEMLKLKDDIIKAKEEVINMLRMQLHPAVITSEANKKE